MASVKRALLLSTGDRYFALLVNFGVVAVVSRLLAPSEIGVSVIATAAVATLMAAKEFASGSYLIQRSELSREHIRAAFTMTFAITGLISAVLYLGAPTFAQSYADERLIPYIRTVSLCLVTELVAAQIVTLLKRDMAFGRVAAINMAGTATTAMATIGFALWGQSYMSFAWAWLICSIVTSALALSLCPIFWMFRPSFRHWGDMIRFGGYNGATIFLVKAYEAVPYLFLGRLFSPDAAALLSRSSTICDLPHKLTLGGAGSVVLPAFATEVRRGGNLKGPYLKGLELFTALIWPAFLVLTLLAYPIVDVLLGHQWSQVAPLVQIVAIASLFNFSFDLNHSALVSVGEIATIFRRALIVFPVAAVIVGVASLYGLRAVAWSLMLVIPFNALVSLQIVRQKIGFEWRDMGAALWRSGVVALSTTLGASLVIIAEGLRFDLSLGKGVAAGLLAVAGWMLGIWCTRHPLGRELTNLPPVRWVAVYLFRPASKASG